jgi:hypothetical protein
MPEPQLKDRSRTEMLREVVTLSDTLGGAGRKTRGCKDPLVERVGASTQAPGAPADALLTPLAIGVASRVA